MKIKKLLSCITATALIWGALPCISVSAANLEIYNDSFVDEYKKGDLSVNWYDQFSTNKAYQAGEVWVTRFGAGEWMKDGDNCLILQSAPGAKSGDELYLYRKLLTEPVPEETEIEVTYDFKTAPEPESSSQEIWFALRAGNKDTGVYTRYNLFQYTATSQNQPKIGVASTTAWPFTGKAFDRDPNHMTFQYDTDYTLKITLKPNKNGTCRFVAEQYENGAKAATGIIEQYGEFKMENMTQLDRLEIIQTARRAHTVSEPILYMKNIAVNVRYADEKPEPALFPADGSVEIPLDTECYMDFDRAVDTIGLANVSIDGGAVIDGITMENDGKRVKLALSNLSANTQYTVHVNGIRELAAESSFEYSWSFKTGGNVEFGEATAAVSHVLADKGAWTIVGKDDTAYENGAAWGSSDAAKAQGVFVAADGSLNANINGKGTLNIAKKFTPIEDGDSLVAKGTMSIVSPYNTGFVIRLENDDSKINMFKMAYDQWNGYAMSAVNNESSSAYNIAEPIFTKVSGPEKASTMLSKKNYHVGADSGGYGMYLSGDMKLTFTMSPNPDGENYDCVAMLQGAEVVYEAMATIPKTEALAYDSVVIEHYSDNSATTGTTMTVKDLEVTRETAFKAGENNIYIPYRNLTPDTPFDAAVLIVERDGENGYGAIQNVTAVSVEDQAGAEGNLVIPFTAGSVTSKIDVFILNDFDEGVLLSKSTALKEAK